MKEKRIYVVVLWTLNTNTSETPNAERESIIRAFINEDDAVAFCNAANESNMPKEADIEQHYFFVTPTLLV